jgi:hypothetical protein
VEGFSSSRCDDHRCHHRHQAAETRRALRREQLINVEHFGEATAKFRRRVPYLEQNVSVYRFLLAHPGAPAEKWPGTINWNSLGMTYVDSAWRVAQQSSILEHMSQDEVRRYAELYRRLQLLNDAALASRGAFLDARSIEIEEPDPAHLTPSQLEQQVTRTSVVLQRLTAVANQQTNLARYFPDFRPSPTREEVQQIFHEPPGRNTDSQVINDVLERLLRSENWLRYSGEDAPSDADAESSGRKQPD